MKSRACSTVRTPRSPIYRINWRVLSNSKLNSASTVEFIARKSRSSVTSICTPLFFEGLDLARLPKHLVDLVEVKLFEEDHFAGVFFERDRFALGKFQEFIIGFERRFFLIQTLAKYVADIVFVRFEQRADLQRRMPTKHRHELSCLTGMHKALVAISL